MARSPALNNNFVTFQLRGQMKHSCLDHWVGLLEEHMERVMNIPVSTIKASLCAVFFFIMGHSALAIGNDFHQPNVTASAVIDAPLDWVWRKWTTRKGLESFFAMSAAVELRTLGKYQVLFTDELPEGSRGSDDGVVLGFQANKMLHFTWMLPPYMPEVRPHHTSVQIFFDAVDNGRTKVTIYQTGWGEGEAWDKAFQYFESAWPNALKALQERAQTVD